MEYIGHSALLERLKKFLGRKNDSRSFLFFGPKHSGKYTLARAFSLAWVKGETVLDFSENESGEVLVVAPRLEEKKGVVKEKGIDVEGVREAIRFVSLSSASGRRAVVIDDAETMTREAQNAFLKTLEEPASGVVIVLVAHTLDTILPTIVSRCDRAEFGIVAKERFYKGMGVGVAEDVWELSLGLPGIGKEILRDGALRAEREALRETGRKLSSLGVGERLRAGEMLAKNIPQAIEALHLWAFLFREEAVAGRGDAHVSLLRAEKMMECARLLKTTQANARLMLENTLLGL